MNNQNNNNKNAGYNRSNNENNNRTSPTTLPKRNFENKFQKNNNWGKRENFNSNNFRPKNPNLKKAIDVRLTEIKPMPVEQRGNPQDVTKFISLGGLQEVGKNCYLVEEGDEIILIDAGMKLMGNENIGIDCMIPAYNYLKDNEKRLKALVITHGHEDHIGAIFYLLKTVKFPIIYAPKLAYNLILNKLKDNRFYDRINIRLYNGKSNIHTKNFSLSFFEENHSIPDAFGVAIRSKNGTIVTTGDYKFDFTPTDIRADYFKMAKLGEEGVDLMLSDSTNALVQGVTLSEKIISEKLARVLSEIKGRIILSTFASNVFRVQQVIKLAQKLNRKILIFGRSMEKISRISQQIGYIDTDPSLIINASEGKKTDLSKLLVLCTGSQGEPLAALSRMANDSHKDIKLMPSDTVIFSSNPIPGNSYSINNIVNLLTRKGVKVIVNSPNLPLHTSGHASKDEQKLMFNLLRPKHFAPIHGEQIMLMEHAQTSIDCGLHPSRTFIIKNGDVLILDKKQVYQSDETVFAQSIFVDGNNFSLENNLMINDRKNMSANGVISCVLNYDGKNKMLLGIAKMHFEGIRFKSVNFVEDLKKLVTKNAADFLAEKQFNEKQVKDKLALFIIKKISDENNVVPVVNVTFVKNEKVEVPVLKKESEPKVVASY